MKMHFGLSGRHMKNIFYVKDLLEFSIKIEFHQCTIHRVLHLVTRIAFVASDSFIYGILYNFYVNFQLNL